MSVLMHTSRPAPAITRRRFLSITAAATGVALSTPARAGSSAEAYRWRGIALGAEADLTLYARSRGEAMEAIAASLAELSRLEAVFSLHQPESALAQLNRTGALDNPPLELVELLSESLSLAQQSGGLFDPTVQPLWQALATHFASAPLSEPDAARFEGARALVDHRLVDVSPSRISLGRRGMQVTLNGMAQGFISDKVAAVLENRGFRHALVNLGEAVATGPKIDGSAWELDIPHPRNRSAVVERVRIAQGAAATSSGAGLIFDTAGLFNHIVDPRRIVGAPVDRSVTVLAPSGSLADGLSTLVALSGPGDATVEAIIRSAGARALVFSGAGQDSRWIG